MWVRESGLCNNCLAKKDNPRNKLCSACHLAEHMADGTCHYTGCHAPTTGGHPYCPIHAAWIKRNGLCYKCLHRKEYLEFKVCETCHRVDVLVREQLKRQLAIKQGLCSNHWMCRNPAAAQGRMCQSCYEQYNKTHPRPEASERGNLSIERPMPPTPPPSPDVASLCDAW
jgi:hypothetical protein